MIAKHTFYSESRKEKNEMCEHINHEHESICETQEIVNFFYSLYCITPLPKKAPQ